MPSKFSNSITLAALSIIGEKSNAMRLEHDAPGPELGVCECLADNGITAYDGKIIVEVGGSPYQYDNGSEYGTSVCAAHDAGREPYCADDEMPDFCGAMWCFVSSDCAASDTTTEGIGQDIYWSYATCGDSADYPDGDEAAAEADADAAADGEEAAADGAADAADAAAEGEDAAAVEGEEAAAAEGEEAAADTADAEDAAAAEGEDAPAASTEGGCKSGQQAVTQKDHKGNNVTICINFMVNVTQAPAAAAAAAADDCDEAEAEAEVVEEATTTDPNAATADADPLSGVGTDDVPVDDGAGAEVTVVEPTDDTEGGAVIDGSDDTGVVDEPVVEIPVVEDPVVEDPVVEDPIVEDPVVEDPVVEEPVDDTPPPSVPSFLCCGPSQNDFNTVMLDEHNARRALHMETGPLCYSAGLEFTAQNWADELATAGVQMHSTEEQRGGPWGENLAFFSNSDPAAQEATINSGAALIAWYDDEVSLYDYAAPGFSDATGHFSQVVWQDTTCLGCAYSGSFIVCHYTPQGNIIGNFPDQVNPLL